MKLILQVTFLILFYVCSSFTQATPDPETQIIQAVKNIDFDTAVKNICKKNKRICRILKDKNIYPYLKKHHKTALLAIAHNESSFKHKIGGKNPSDRGYFQVNTKIWSPEKIYKAFGIRTSIWRLTHDIDHQASVALHIWLYNCGMYILKRKRYPPNLPYYVALYNNPFKISKKYSSKARKFIWGKGRKHIALVER